MNITPQVPMAFERLSAGKKVIADRWVARANESVSAANEIDLPALIDSLPAFLDSITQALNPSSESKDGPKLMALAAAHGTQRAFIKQYTLDQVIAEYGLLQDVILGFLKEVGPLEIETCATLSRIFASAIRDATSAFVQVTEERKMASEIQFERLVKDAKDIAIFMISPDGIILTWNEGATRIKQFTSEEVIGKHFRMLYREEDRNEGRPELNIKLTIENGRFEEQWWRVKKDGTLWWAEAILTAIYSPGGNLIGIAKIVRDLTYKKNLDDQLREALAAAEAANNHKSTFVANMSHEIRTPLGAILGFAELLKDPLISPADREESIQIIDRNGKVLLRLIEDILDISKIEAGKLHFERTEVRVRSIMPEIIALFELRAKAKGLSVTLEVDRETPDYVTTDAVRLRQILSNLIGNALKFTDKGGVRVIVGPHSENEHKTGLAIYVSDTGLGIADDKRGRIFGEFSQADASITRKYGGSGLGLALSRSLARELGGDIELLDCPPGIGCTFKITIVSQILPGDTEARADAIITRNETQVHPQSLSYRHVNHSKVLIVDDSPDNQLLVKRILTKVGAETEFASNGAEGIDKALRGTFDIVLMDVQMPVLDGNGAVERLRASGYDKPIIALSAHAMIEDRLISLKAGCDDYVSKPINSSELLNALEKWISQGHPH